MSIELKPCPFCGSRAELVEDVECGGHGSTLASIARSILIEYYKGGVVSDVETFENRIS